MLLNCLPTAEFYNSLPLINDGTVPLADKDLVALGSIIRKHGMEYQYQIHLVHRHFDMPEGHVLASTISKNGLEVHMPIIVPVEAALQGTHFHITNDGNFQAFEYKTVLDGTQPRFSQAKDFQQEFAAAVIAAGLQDRVALTHDDNRQTMREIVGDNWTVHYPCDNLRKKCVKAKTIAVGWRFEANSGQPIQCNNWYIDPSNENNHRTGTGGDSIEPRIESADSVLEVLEANEIMCCA